MKIATILVGAVVSCMALGLIWQGTELRKREAANQQSRAETAQLSELRSEVERWRQIRVDKEELARLRESETARLQEIARLRGQLGALLRSQTNAISTNQAGSSNSTNNNSGFGLAGVAANWLKAAGEQSVEAQIVRARERLNLSQEQEQAVRGIVNKSLQEGRENLQKVLSGQASFEDVPTQMQWAKSMEQEILSALTPEQQTAYQKYKREDVAANARLVANGELLSVQNSLGLSQEQQDQVFAVLYNQAVNQLDPDPNTLATQPHNPLSAAELLGKQKLETLQGVLTPSQLETYRHLQESYLVMLKGTLGQIGNK
jgi:hypothetical protein